MANYYSKFLPYLTKIAALLYKLLYENVKWLYSLKYTETMHALQKALPSLPLLYLPDFQKTFHLETNASNFVISGVPLQC